MAVVSVSPAKSTIQIGMFSKVNYLVEPIDTEFLKKIIKFTVNSRNIKMIKKKQFNELERNRCLSDAQKSHTT